VGHARAALSWIGDKPNAARCRALRALATATMAKGETETGFALLESAITTAALIRDPIEEASALQLIGRQAVRCQHFVRAEDRFRKAIDLLSNTGPSNLQATLHHELAAVLHVQRKNDEEAAAHAIAAFDLREDKDSRLAQDDRALLAGIHARRLSRD
jgi:tetratricopeptide (TPR) repeat protein